ncbi:MAG: acyl-CoA dehydrogenase [Ignavibacteriales bacterium]
MSNSQGNFMLLFTEEQLMIQENIRDFAEQKVQPVVMEFDEKQEFQHDLMRELGEMGYLGILVPQEYGGSGLGYTEFVIVVEELAKVDPSLALSVAAHNGLCTNHILVNGSEAQKKKYLPDLATGKKIGMWGLTESFSGSDAAAMRTTAKKDGDQYILNGSKNFITHASVGQTAVVMAVSDAAKGKKGISAFILEKGMPGFSTGKKENKLGMRASDTAQLIFDNCAVPAENLIGVDGEGFIQTMKILEGGRISIAALSVGLAEGALLNSVKYSGERQQFGKPINSFQAIQFKLADMATAIEASRLLTYKAAWLKDNQKPIMHDAAIAKLFSSETAEKCAIEAVQIFGGYGFTKDYPVEKFYRDVKLLTIGEGTSEVQRLVIARKFLQD